jgi:antitoxin MazE
MRSRVVRIGNSQGIRIPKSLLKEAKLTDAVDITVVGSALVLRSTKRHAREGWAEAARNAHEAGEDKLLDGWHFPNEFDHSEWEWPGLE